MTERPEPSQSLQRVKVGLIGLAAVVLLIAMASAILGSATRDQSAAGLAQGNLVAQIAAGNSSAAATGEPLAEMGVAPSAGNLQDATAPPLNVRDRRNHAPGAHVAPGFRRMFNDMHGVAPGSSRR